MKLHIFSYRFAEEILQHARHGDAWKEIHDVVSQAPLFIYPNKSKKNKKLDVVQQVMNTYFDRVLAVDRKWVHHPLATGILDSKLTADFQKKFGEITVQAEVQFGNMSRWYSDIFKFQAAYSQSLIQVGVSIVPMASLAKRIDSNIVQFERAKRELPSATLSITLPILMIGIEPDAKTPVIDISKSKFKAIADFVGEGRSDNRWRIVHGYLNNVSMPNIGPKCTTGPKIEDSDEEE